MCICVGKLVLRPCAVLSMCSLKPLTEKKENKKKDTFGNKVLKININVLQNNNNKKNHLQGVAHKINYEPLPRW